MIWFTAQKGQYNQLGTNNYYHPALDIKILQIRASGTNQSCLLCIFQNDTTQGHVFHGSGQRTAERKKIISDQGNKTGTHKNASC